MDHSSGQDLSCKLFAFGTFALRSSLDVIPKVYLNMISDRQRGRNWSYVVGEKFKGKLPIELRGMGFVEVDHGCLKLPSHAVSNHFNPGALIMCSRVIYDVCINMLKKQLRRFPLGNTIRQ